MILKPPKDWRFYFKWIGLGLIFASIISIIGGNKQFQVILLWGLVILILSYFTKGGKKFYNKVINKFVK